MKAARNLQATPLYLRDKGRDEVAGCPDASACFPPAPRFRPRGKARFVGWLLALLIATSPLLAFAQAASNPAPLQFQDNTEETRFHALVSELRCVMCQNQSLADSDAMIAHDLRREVLKLMREGRTDAQIKQFLVARYGEFVLYKPRVESRTWLLWFGPALLLLLGGLVIARILRKRTAVGAIPQDEPQEW